MRRLLFLLAAIAALLAFLYWQFPYALNSADNKFDVFLSICWLVFMASGLVMHMKRENMPRALRDAGIWIVIILALVACYTYRDVFLNSRIAAELMPYRPQLSGTGAMTFRAVDNGHFHIEAEVNGKLVKFLVDTGASDIVLSPQDAARLNLGNLVYDRFYQTANGTVQGASVMLNTLRIGTLTAENISASVNRTEMNESLLGMSFLRRFGKISIDGDTLTLEP